MRTFVFAVVLFILAVSLLTVGLLNESRKPNVINDKILPSCVYVEALDEHGQRMWSGSGVVAGGRIITAAHVLRGAKALRILDYQGNDVEYEAYYHSDKNDFGFIVPKDCNLPSVDIVDSNDLERGDLIYATGAPYGLALFPTISCGIVSNDDVHNSNHGKNYLISFDATAGPGMSGGGVFDADGNLVGIAIAMRGIFILMTPSEVILNDWYLSPLYKKELSCRKQQ